MQMHFYKLLHFSDRMYFSQITSANKNRFIQNLNRN